MDKMVIGGSDNPFGLLEELMKQLKSGVKTGGQKGLTLNQFNAFLEHRNPFVQEQSLKVLPYADEEVESTYDYPKGFSIKSVTEQLAIWQKEFPNLDASHVLDLAKGDLPEGSEGWGVIPKPSKFGNYYQALEEMLELLGKSRIFQNCREGELDEKHLRLKKETADILAKLEAKTPGDYLVIPFQFGLKHRGRSIRRPIGCFAAKELGFGPFELAALLLTHQDRITGTNHFYIDCAGCEYSLSADGVFVACLYFYWVSSDGHLVLDDCALNNGNKQWGYASGFFQTSVR